MDDETTSIIILGIIIFFVVIRGIIIFIIDVIIVLFIKSTIAISKTTEEITITIPLALASSFETSLTFVIRRS
jgi:hypothetical protein